MRRGILSLLAVVMFIGMFQDSEAFFGKKKKQDKKFVLITMDSLDEHWQSVKKGAEEKTEELEGVELIFKAPEGKVDPNEQIKMVTDAITQKVDAILIAPSDKFALTPVVERAAAGNIPVIIIDSPLDSDRYLSFIATDNYAAAETAADKMAELTGAKGKIGIINAQPGSGTTISREDGFKDRVASEYPHMKITAIMYSNGDEDKASNQAAEILTANPDLVGFYTGNEGSTVGVARALTEAGKAGKVKLVGFDRSGNIMRGIEEGVIDASMVQNPKQMGYKAVEAAYNFITDGTEPVKYIDTGVKVVTKENIEDLK